MDQKSHWVFPVTQSYLLSCNGFGVSEVYDVFPISDF